MLVVVTGPMFAGKTKWLIEWCEAGKNKRAVQVFRPKQDDRHRCQNIKSHNGEKFPAMIVENNLNRVPIDDPFVDVFVFDEAQFFYPDQLVSVVRDILFVHKRGVLIAGLCQDAFGNPFGAMPTLLSMADTVVHLKANCSKCNTRHTATRTYRKVRGGGQTLVGGTELYEPRCFKCWREDDANTSKDPKVQV